MRKGNQAILISIYAVLLLLLLLGFIRSCVNVGDPPPVATWERQRPYEPIVADEPSATTPPLAMVPKNPPQTQPLPTVPTPPSGGGAASRADRIGHDGRLKITLLWDFPGDIDLHVIEPNRNEIFFNNKVDSATGGYLDVDNTVGGRGSAENIYWADPPSGRYQVSLVYYAANPSCPNGGRCTVVIKREVGGRIVHDTYHVNMNTPNRGVRVPVKNFTVH